MRSPALQHENSLNPNPLRILLLVCIKDTRTRRQMLLYCQSSDGTALTHTRPGLERVAETRSLETAALELKTWYAQSDSCAAIVLSDLLVQGSEPSGSAKNLFNEFGTRLYATIAVMDHPEKVLDIDRTISRECSTDEFRGVLKLCSDRLDYLRRPQVKQSLRSVEIRPLRWEFEFLDYFRLRHEVYLPMSYLDPLVEQAPSRMEIDWFDKKSVHLGAFEDGGFGREKLIGTARLITTETISQYQYQYDMAKRAAENDEVLDQIVTNGATLGMLPVFQRGEMLKELRVAVSRGLVFGELSRVIVRPGYRGAGLSYRICEFAVSTARRARVSKLFLECLPIHAELYRKVGFEIFSQLRGKVYGIDKTMIVMHLPLRDVQSPQSCSTGPIAH